LVPVATAGEVSKGGTVAKSVEQKADVFGTAGQQLVSTHDAGVLVELDVGSDRGCNLFGHLVEATSDDRADFHHLRVDIRGRHGH
jgi:hypothetical protein